MTLTQDLNCSGDGLKIFADHTVVNLNGHKIKCTGTGYLGSCQTVANAAGGGPWAGIHGYNRFNVTIQGPGTINGFEKGIHVEFGRGWTNTGVNITGPSNPAYHVDERGPSVGIYLYLVTCDTGLNLRQSPSATISENQVGNHSTGILLMADSCTLVKNNTAYLNAGGTGGSYGINLMAGKNNTVYNHMLWGNGYSSANDAGINLMQASYGNHVTSNTLTGNCGSGIKATDIAYQNVMQLNSAIGNPYNAADGRCPALPAGSSPTWSTPAVL